MILDFSSIAFPSSDAPKAKEVELWPDAPKAKEPALWPDAWTKEAWEGSDAQAEAQSHLPPPPQPEPQAAPVASAVTPEPVRPARASAPATVPAMAPKPVPSSPAPEPVSPPARAERAERAAPAAPSPAARVVPQMRSIPQAPSQAESRAAERATSKSRSARAAQRAAAADPIVVPPAAVVPSPTPTPEPEPIVESDHEAADDAEFFDLLQQQHPLEAVVQRGLQSTVVAPQPTPPAVRSEATDDADFLDALVSGSFDDLQPEALPASAVPTALARPPEPVAPTPAAAPATHEVLPSPVQEPTPAARVPELPAVEHVAVAQDPDLPAAQPQPLFVPAEPVLPASPSRVELDFADTVFDTPADELLPDVPSGRSTDIARREQPEHVVVFGQGEGARSDSSAGPLEFVPAPNQKKFSDVPFAGVQDPNVVLDVAAAGLVFVAEPEKASKSKVAVAVAAALKPGAVKPDTGHAPPLRHGGKMVPLPITINKRTFDDFLKAVVELTGLADILLQSGDYVWCKLHGTQRCISDRKLDPEEVDLIAGFYYGLSAIGKANSGEALDFRAEVHRNIDDTVSFRANATRGRVGENGDGISITMRFVTDVPRVLSTLGLEDDVTDNMFASYGLTLVVGTTGSGKSTILSSVMRERLTNPKYPPVKIGSFEDPIEYTYQSLGLGVMPLVSQVEIGRGRHLTSFSQVGPNAMRRGFDVLIVGEMRDRESVEAAFELAMTGHSVYATLHVETPAQVIDRIVSFFPEDAQPSAASKLRSVLRMVLAQKQFANRLGESERLRSWCVFDREVQALLAESKWHQWERILTEVCAKRKTDFDSRVLDILLAGRLTFDQFRAQTGLTRKEALAYCEQRGVDVNDLQ